MAGEGQMLRAAREEKHWSLTETEETTKIRVRYIQALEDEEYGILPGTTYVKGYLRTYAKQLGLDSDEIITLYNASVKPDAGVVLHPPHITHQARSRWLKPALIGLMAVLGLVLVITIANFKSGNKLKPDTYTPAALPSAPKTDVVTPTPTTPSAPVVTNSADVAATTQEGLTAELVFIQPCWVEVKVDGQPAFQGTYTSGTTKEVKGTSKIELVTVGNAGGLTVTLNGKTVPSLGKSGQVVHNVILSLETLKTL